MDNKKIRSIIELSEDDLIHVPAGTNLADDLYDPVICANISGYLDHRCDGYVNQVRSLCSHYEVQKFGFVTRYTCHMGRFDVTIDGEPGGK